MSQLKVVALLCILQLSHALGDPLNARHAHNRRQGGHLLIFLFFSVLIFVPCSCDRRPTFVKH